ncbi:HNH endonuclease signature motif containing protein, partial [Pseudorhodoferax sp.]|uniref:HNH endonuclease signature motif containing protein n=1 Tax=Pseudorhodoferax sp. TaxID=1993553 RepID=UPI002DD6AC29
TVVATIADHIVPHKGDLGRFFDRGNLQSLCKPCHDNHKQAQDRHADGLLRGAGLDGRPLDLAHPWHRPVEAGGAGEKSGAAEAKTGSVLVVRRPAKSTGGVA